MTVATKALLVETYRHLQGILSAFKVWLDGQEAKPKA